MTTGDLPLVARTALTGGSKALAEYAKLAGPAVLSAGGRNFVRGMPAKTFEAGLDRRTIVVEFDSLATAISAYESPIRPRGSCSATRLFGIPYYRRH